ncbi:MAG: hypothetical protein ACTIDY_05175 [Halomonadaceae bacterium]|uniref:Uncharacterized protein n=1 Tax=Halomonas colorata TaxID=2742615 RepID=A0ABR9FV39_9GAMM|nr:hypothetical protein [Halomonas colorata]MBE0462516.1 hypothetical protein [Halomonas colorata]
MVTMNKRSRDKHRIKALLLAAIVALSTLGLAGCGADDPPNENAQPEPEEPLNQGPMANDDANGLPPTEDGT